MAAPQIPASQKAMVFNEPGTVSTELVDLPVPEPGPGEVLVNLTHSGVCHSDYGVMTSSWSILPYPTQKGQVGGHEGVGNIVKLGAGSEATGVKVGDRVGIKWIAAACGNCLPCLSGSEGLCNNSKISGYYHPGTFQQYAIGPANYVTPIPEGIDSATAAPMLCAGVTVYSALKRSKVKPGQWVVISGAGGGLGHLAVQIAAKAMSMQVIGIDHHSKEELVKASGASHFLDITKFPKDDKGKALGEKVKELADGHGAHGVLVCTAANAAYGQALAFMRFDGTLVCVGIPEGDPVDIAGVDPGKMISGQFNIVGSAVGSRREAIEVLDFVKRGLVKSHVRIEKMDKLTSIFQEMEAGTLQGRVVIELSG